MTETGPGNGCPGLAISQKFSLIFSLYSLHDHEK